MEPETHVPKANVGHETSDIHVRPLTALMVVLALVCVLSLWLTRRMLTSYETTAERLDAPVHPLAPAQETPPPPLLQEHPGRDLAQYEQSVRQQLDSYGWIDKPQGIVHIPIERAIELTAERGLPAREAR
jgi:hypothetical protein